MQKRENQARYLELGVAVCYFLTGIFARADTVFVSNATNNTIERFNSDEDGSVFGSGLSSPTFITVQPVPEAATRSLLALGVGALPANRRFRRAVHCDSLSTSSQFRNSLAMGGLGKHIERGDAFQFIT